MTFFHAWSWQFQFISSDMQRICVEETLNWEKSSFGTLYPMQVQRQNNVTKLQLQRNWSTIFKLQQYHPFNAVSIRVIWEDKGVENDFVQFYHELLNFFRAFFHGSENWFHFFLHCSEENSEGKFFCHYFLHCHRHFVKKWLWSHWDLNPGLLRERSGRCQ